MKSILMFSSIVLILLLIFTACEQEPAEPAEPAVPNYVGTWLIDGTFLYYYDVEPETKNFVLNPTPFTSSINPNATNIPDPIKSALTNAFDGAHMNIDANAPIAITTPPILGMGSQ